MKDTNLVIANLGHISRKAIPIVLTLSVCIAPVRASAQSAKGLSWCGPRLETVGDKKEALSVSLPGRLILKTFPKWIWDKKAEREADLRWWVLVLDYETPVLTDLGQGMKGSPSTIKEVQLFQYGGLSKRYERFRNKHVLVTGVLHTSLYYLQATDVYLWESRIVPIGPVSCDGKPMARH